jgi:phytoene dehydrogenase-like protein
VSEYDAIIIGAGHNGLVAAAYLAQAGQRVCVFERQDRVGGAVATEEVVPGYRFDLGGSAHILIRLTPIVEELGLDRYGLEYIELDPLFFAPFEDGDSFFIYRDLDRTAAQLDSRFPGQGEAYRLFCERWRPFAHLVRDTFLSAPGPLELGRRFLLSRGMRSDWRRAAGEIMQPYGTIIEHYFAEEKLRAPLTWMAAQSGPPPFEPLTAPFLFWQPLYHEGGIARPRGGSGMLTQALRRCIEAAGGAVHVGAAVDRIVVRNGRATGVVVQGETHGARAVIAACHAVETFSRLLPEEWRPPGARLMRTGNGFGAVLRLALNAPVRYAAHPGRDARTGLQLLCRDRRQIDVAYADYLCGRPAADPPIVAMTFSAVDDSLAPPGGEVLWLWAQYYPYRLAEGHWDDIGEAVADSILAQFEKYAPGTRDTVVGSLFQHPLWLERELGLVHGNVMHLEMSVAQMFALRPFAGMSGYRTHLEGLYLTGASTHPGGGIMGASGRTAARVVLRSLQRRWWAPRRGRGSSERSDDDVRRGHAPGSSS